MGCDVPNGMQAQRHEKQPFWLSEIAFRLWDLSITCLSGMLIIFIEWEGLQVLELGGFCTYVYRGAPSQQAFCPHHSTCMVDRRKLLVITNDARGLLHGHAGATKLVFQRTVHIGWDGSWLFRPAYTGQVRQGFHAFGVDLLYTMEHWDGFFYKESEAIKSVPGTFLYFCEGISFVLLLR